MPDQDKVHPQAKADACALLQSLRDQHLLRKLRVPEGASSRIDLNSNDYLGLSEDLDLRRKVVDRCLALPQGSGGSRLLGGNYPEIVELEATFAEFKRCEASLLFGSGYLANIGLVKALGALGYHFFSDQYIHASMIDGLKLAGCTKSIFSHQNLTQLETLLSNSRSKVNVILVESVYSMDGDKSPLQDLFVLAERYRGLLVVDEAHAIGVFGDQGRGLIDEVGLDHSKIISINPCGKALASQGAFIGGPRWVVDLMTNLARSFIYSTAPSPWNVACLALTLEKIRSLQEKRDHLQKMAELLGVKLRDMGFSTGLSESQIVTVNLPSNQKALAAEGFLQQTGFICQAVRPPTVPSSRLRLTLRASMSKSVIEQVGGAFRELTQSLDLSADMRGPK